jgi:hypothetical protein
VDFQFSPRLFSGAWAGRGHEASSAFAFQFHRYRGYTGLSWTSQQDAARDDIKVGKVPLRLVEEELDMHVLVVVVVVKFGWR